MADRYFLSLYFPYSCFKDAFEESISMVLMCSFGTSKLKYISTGYPSPILHLRVVFTHSLYYIAGVAYVKIPAESTGSFANLYLIQCLGYHYYK